MTLVLTLVGSALDAVATVSLLPVVEQLGIAGDGRGASQQLDRLLSPVGLDVTLASALGVFLVLTATRAATMGVGRMLGTHLRLTLVDDLRRRCLDALLRTPWTFVLQRRRSDLVQILTADVNRVGAAVDVSVGLLSSLMLTAASVAVALSIAPGPAAMAMALAFGLLLITRPVLQSARRLGIRLGQANRHFAGLVTDSLDAFKLVRAHRVEDRWLDDLDSGASDVRQLVMRHTRASTITGAVIELGSTAGIVVVLAVWFELAGAATATGLVVLYAIARILRQVGGIQRSIQHLQNLLPAYDELMSLTHDAHLAAAGAQSDTMATPQPIELPEQGRTLVELRDASFSYPNAETPTLHDIELVLPALRTTALVGPSGAGKTTLADITLGLLEPQTGSMLLGGQEAGSGHISWWQRHTAYVPQEPMVMPVTLRENLTWLAPTASDDDCWLVLDDVGADFARRLTSGLDTPLGDRGIRLSGGERQRLAIARALLRRPVFLVLDEATSALDDEREEVVQATLDRLRGQTTVLVIAHRLRTIRNADQVVVMDGGRVVESGTWDELSGSDDSRFSVMLRRHAAL